MKRIAPPVVRALRLSVMEGSLFAVYWNVVAGVIINGLALALGAKPLHMSILNGLPLLSQAFGLPAARMIQSRDVRKPFVLAAEGISRFTWILIPIAFIFFPAISPSKIWLLLIVAAISHSVHWGGAVAWLSWVSDLVPEQIRGVYFGTRNAIAGLVGMIGLTLASGWADRVKTLHGEGQHYLNTLLSLIGIAIVFAVMSWAILFYQPVRKLRNLDKTGYAAIWRTLATANGRKIAVTWVTFAFACGVQVGLYMPFMLDRLQMSMVSVTLYSWVALIMVTISTPIWGRIADRYGNRTILILGWLGVWWQPLLWVFTTSKMHYILGIAPWTIIADAILSGLFWPAIGLAQTNLVIAETPSQTRAGLFAALSALTGLAGFAAAVIGGNVANWVGVGNTVHLGPMVMDDLQLPLFVGSVLRFVFGLLMFRIEEPPRKNLPIPSSVAFATVWRLLVGRGYFTPRSPVALNGGNGNRTGMDPDDL